MLHWWHWLTRADSLLNSILIPVLVNDCVFHGTHWLNLHSMLTIWLQTRSKCVPHSWICMSDGSLGSLHRWRSQRIAKYWSCELQDTLAQLFFWAAEHLTYSTYTSLAVSYQSLSFNAHRLTAARSAESAVQFLIGLASLLCLHKFFPPCCFTAHAGNLSIFSPTNGVLLHYEEIICPTREIESMT